MLEAADTIVTDTAAAAAPERRCLVSGEAEPRAGLVRFVVGPDDTVVPDVDERLPGRGFWVTASAACVGEAAKRGLFARAARRKVSVPDDLTAVVEWLLARRLMSLIALARRAGVAIAGAEKIAAAPPGLVLLARDAGTDARRRGGARGEILACALDADELGAAFDYGRAALVWIGQSGFTESIARECARLGGFRGVPAGAPQVE